MELNNKVTGKAGFSGNYNKEMDAEKSNLDKQVEKVKSEVVISHAFKSEESSRLSSITVKDRNEERMLRFKQICAVLFASHSSSTEERSLESQGMWAPLLQSLIGDRSARIQENIQELSPQEAQVICAQVYQLNLDTCESNDDLAVKAAEKNCPNLLKFLLDCGVNIESCDPYGNTLLMLASLQGNAQMVRDLVKAEAQVEAADYYGTTALMAATLRGYVDVVRELRKAHAQIDPAIDEQDAAGETLLTNAILKGQEKVALALIEAGADVDVYNKKGRTALLCAAESGQTTLVRALIEADAGVHMTDREGNTALMLAVKEGHLEIVQELREAHASVEDHNKKGHTSLMLAAMYGKQDVVEALLQRTAGGRAAAAVNASYKEGSAFMCAALNGQVEIMGVLKNAGADLEATDQRGCTALSYEIASNGPDTEMAHLLKDWGDVDYANEFLRRKIIAHIWGIKGKSALINKAGVRKTFELEGLYPKYAMNHLYDYAKEFFRSNELADRCILKENQNKILESLANSFPLSQNLHKAVESIQANDPFVILGGEEGHAISIVICKNELIICNRGYGRKANAVERYALPSSLVSEELLKTLSTQYVDVGEFNSMIFGLRLKPLGGFNQKEQKVGNCTWASGKGALGILCRVYADPNWGTANEGANQAAERGKALYKKFTFFAREKSHKDYLKESPKPIQDIGILQAIKNKIERKSAIAAAAESSVKPSSQIRSFFQKITPFKKVV